MIFEIYEYHAKIGFSGQKGHCPPTDRPPRTPMPKLHVCLLLKYERSIKKYNTEERKEKETVAPALEVLYNVH